MLGNRSSRLLFKTEHSSVKGGFFHRQDLFKPGAQSAKVVLLRGCSGMIVTNQHLEPNRQKYRQLVNARFITATSENQITHETIMFVFQESSATMASNETEAFAP